MLAIPALSHITYKLACPTNHSPAPNGQMYNTVTNKYRAYICLPDNGNGPAIWNDQASGGPAGTLAVQVAIQLGI